MSIIEDSLGNYNFKIVVVGDGACGKTSLLLTYAYGVFPTTYVPTVFENYTASATLENGKTVKLGLWDTAGQEDYDRLRPLSFPDASLVLISFAVDDPVSLENVLEKWWPEVNHYCQTGTPIVLAGLKTDLRTDPDTVRLLRSQGQSPVSSEQGRSVARRIGDVPYVECSALLNQGVNDVFGLVISTLLRPQKKKKGKNGKKECMIL
ncbi:P-loop containing nucleoside triphosphate hydrolase protein [Lipomyces japonicus]|uniref:P-loop containing nucleoside triphosphate hydrolase protein n=1 Tax=Lipomyces japonicus TaxID=56871 RepID=UPI0034CF97F9